MLRKESEKLFSLSFHLYLDVWFFLAEGFWGPMKVHKAAFPS